MSDDFISRQAAIDSIADLTFNVTISGKQGFQNYKEEVEKVFVVIRDKHIEALKNLPSVEDEPVLRCKECEYFSEPNSFSGKCTLRGDYIFTNDFCSYAVERRTDE